GDDYPYFVNTGFSLIFIKTENYLCIHDEKGDCLRDSRGHVVLACMCGIVINAKFNQDKPFFTKEGSFWTNSTSDLLASTTAEEREGTTRNVCNQNGYESVALIPIKVKDDIIGLLQINDKRRNLFPSGGIQFLEELGHIIGISIEHTKTEEALVESEKRYRTYINNAPDGVFVVDANGKYIEVNEAACRMAGYSSEELLNMSIPELLAPTSIKVGLNGFKQLKCKGTLSDVLLLRRRDGTAFYVALDAVKLSDNRFMAYCKDITARKEAEEEIRKLSYAIEQSIDGISISDLEPKMLYVNDAFARMHGYTPKGMIGMPVEKLLKKEYVCEFKSRINQIKTNGFWKGETEHIRKDGTAFPTYMSVTLLKNNDDKPIGMLAVARDITESKQKEKELNIYRERMTRTEKLASVGTLSATLAHELTQPLTVIRLSIQNSLADLKTISCPSTVVEDLKKGLSEISNFISIINKFRNFARISPEKNTKKVDLREIAERIMELLDENAWRAKVTLQVKGMDMLPPIYSYEKDLEHLYYSLVENSIQAADGKKRRQVIISSAIRDGHIELQFSDNCGGIVPKNLKRIFEPFFTTKDANERTGLGLCVVEHIVSRLNGKIRVKSKLGKGSTFFVSLPIKGEQR
ncbi:MAG: PAS domain S-box protein, partial [Planctomycetes bacterium]|nr:PAS domain S-box protein [Planctomycetota bacterium]